MGFGALVCVCVCVLWIRNSALLPGNNSPSRAVLLPTTMSRRASRASAMLPPTALPLLVQRAAPVSAPPPQQAWLIRYNSCEEIECLVTLPYTPNHGTEKWPLVKVFISDGYMSSYLEATRQDSIIVHNLGVPTTQFESCWAERERVFRSVIARPMLQWYLNRCENPHQLLVTVASFPTGLKLDPIRTPNRFTVNECLHELGYQAHNPGYPLEYSWVNCRYWEHPHISGAYTLEHLHLEWQRLACKTSQAMSSSTS